ncbi:transporter substrate-binding domain-containing protein [Alteromonas sp. ASW11-36]|uniref:Transporter substrate-binding domain-containing protein n=1 Tax=Alteromonas arenosi TaxID=3055817 RepID=A0ABT7SUD8_9ALTE|nr:transporter substrate-binding domain-containing protein [Alteromonas sp. ASW11-36]MDM7859812.1 transporter substrate-binding domain-containing protein [Alteromonas sp. ASW11-36]
MGFVDAPPYSFLDRNQQPAGQLIDVFKVIATELKLTPEFIYVPHKRQLAFIEQGMVDLWAGQKDSRVSSDLALTSEKPLFVMELSVFWPDGGIPVGSFEHLKGKHLILISSYSYGGRFEALVNGAANVSYAINHEDALDKLHQFPAAYMLGYSSITKQLQQKYQLDAVKQHALDRIPLFAKLSTQFANAEQTIIEINAVLASLESQ